MNYRIRSTLDHGFDGIAVDVECHISNGLPNILIVGFANKAVDEARERIRAAFSSGNIPLPKKRIIINLAPADIPKDSPSLDLAIAVSILKSSELIRNDWCQNTVFIGELGLDGAMRPVRGIIGKLLAGKNLGFKKFVVPPGNIEQAMLLPGIEVFSFPNIGELYTTLVQSQPAAIRSREPSTSKTPRYSVDFDDIVGQERAKRAMAIAAAGGHNVLMSGPPGTGKSMLAKALQSILPPLQVQEVLEVTHLHSLAANTYDQIVTTRPFRSPHHTASNIAIVGGGHKLRPGDISLSHRGILLLDEFPEFKRDVIESLRQPLEDHTVTISRAKESVIYPADFILVATANPCPCGYYGSDKPCRCLPHDIVRYQRKLSGPIMDRIDLHIEVAGVDHAHLLPSEHKTQVTGALREAVVTARAMQRTRFGSEKLNSAMTNRDLSKLAHIAPDAKTLLDRAAQQLDISARSYMRTIKVARTIADISKDPMVKTSHITEALQYRSQIKQFELMS